MHHSFDIAITKLASISAFWPIHRVIAGFVNTSIGLAITL
jgi:hypothetical protein